MKSYYVSKLDLRKYMKDKKIECMVDWDNLSSYVIAHEDEFGVSFGKCDIMPEYDKYYIPSTTSYDFEEIFKGSLLVLY